MMKFSKKQMALAVGTVLGAASMIPSAQAVNLATDGLGQVLIFPYYTTRAGWNTLFNITNTSDKVVAVKVRFHEAQNSREVFDFNVIMSPQDVWNGWVTNDPTDDMPVFYTNDKTCTTPQLTDQGRRFEGVIEGFEYRQWGGRLSYTDVVDANLGIFNYAADDGDNLGDPQNIQRMREGYVTVIMMGAAEETDDLASNAVHNLTTGIPKDCARLRRAFADGNNFDELNDPGTGFPQYQGLNPLKGFFSLVNATKGQNAGGSAVTLANFRQGVDGAIGSDEGSYVTLQLPHDYVNEATEAQQYARSLHEPSLNSANTPGLVLLADGTVQQAPVVPAEPMATNYYGAHQVSWVLLRDKVVNHWTRNTNPDTRFLTASDWVMTFPTKGFYVDDPQARLQGPRPRTEWSAINEFRGRPRQSPGAALLTTSPFNQLWDKYATTFARSCDPVVSYVYDREEGGGPATIFSPGLIRNSLCLEANVLTFDGSNVLGSAKNNDVRPLPGTSGWMSINLANRSNTLNGGSVTTANPGFGLPVVGFSITTRTIPGSALMSEAYVVDHSYTRREPFAPAQP
jgi:hypothetical protein